MQSQGNSEMQQFLSDRNAYNQSLMNNSKNKQMKKSIYRTFGSYFGLG